MKDLILIKIILLKLYKILRLKGEASIVVGDLWKYRISSLQNLAIWFQAVFRLPAKLLLINRNQILLQTKLQNRINKNLPKLLKLLRPNPKNIFKLF